METPVLQKFKDAFAGNAQILHFNHAGQSLLSKPAYDQLLFCAQLFLTEGALSWPQLAPVLERAKHNLAQFLGAKPQELAYFQSAAGAISQIALGFPFQAGDEILVWDQEYPSNFYPWIRAAEKAKAQIIQVPSGPDLSTPVEAMLERITPRTRMIATSWVQYKTGATLDLKRLTDQTRPQGIFVCADIIQGAGVRPFNFHESGVDAACGGSHKWMVAGHGAGYLLLREEHFEKISPVMFGAMSYGTPDDPTDIHRSLRFGASRFEPGGKAFAEVAALGASAELLNQTGIQNIFIEAQRLCRRLKSGLEDLHYKVHSPHGSEFSGAILNFAPTEKSPQKTIEVVEGLMQKNKVSYAKRAPGIRVSTHAMVTNEHVDHLLKLLA